MAQFSPEQKRSPPKNGSSFGRRKEPYESGQEKPPEYSAAALQEADEPDVSVLIQQELPPQFPTNSNKMSPVQVSDSVEEHAPLVSSYLDKSYKTIWAMIKESTDFLIII